MSLSRPQPVEDAPPGILFNAEPNGCPGVNMESNSHILFRGLLGDLNRRPEHLQSGVQNAAIAGLIRQDVTTPIILSLSGGTHK